MSVLWTGEAMVEAMGGRPLGTLPEEVGGISIDSRSLEPGDAFFAIRGERFDGHDFATAAVKAGAALLVVAEGKLPALGRLTAPMIVVDDVLAALGRLGAAARARSHAKIVAVTGSVGKTTTKEALRTALSACGRVHASAKSFNNHWGVPLTLALMPEDCDFAVFEIGMNHPDEIRPLAGLVRPHVAIVTLIAPAHLGAFRDLDEIARAKAEIFEGVEPGGHALLNRDDERFDLLAGLAREAGLADIRSFGEDARADYRLAEAEAGDGGSTITAEIAGRTVRARVGAPGRHMIRNALAVLGAAHLAGADVDEAAAALSGLTAEAGRGRRHRLALEGGEAVLIDESYNANPASMKAAVELLAASAVGEGGRRIAVLGDMLELGERSAELHAGIAGMLGEARIDMAYLGGEEMKALAGAMPPDVEHIHRAGVAELVAIVPGALRPGDVVMVKSSKGAGFSELVEALVGQFAPAGRTEPA